MYPKTQSTRCIRHAEILCVLGWRRRKVLVLCATWLNFKWKERKYNRGKHFSQTWLFVISQPSQHKCMIVPVSKLDKSTLMDIILFLFYILIKRATWKLWTTAGGHILIIDAQCAFQIYFYFSRYGQNS